MVPQRVEGVIYAASTGSCDCDPALCVAPDVTVGQLDCDCLTAQDVEGAGVGGGSAGVWEVARLDRLEQLVGHDEGLLGVVADVPVVPWEEELDVEPVVLWVVALAP